MEKRQRRSSILKVRQQIDICKEEIEGSSSSTTTINDRRVSFQNVKHVKQYDKECGNFLHHSPLKEKITDTMDSDGILTPRGRSVDSTFSIHQTPQVPPDLSSMPVFSEITKNTTMDMSIENYNNDEKTIDMSIDETKFEEKSTKCVIYEKTTTMKRTTTSLNDDTMSIFYSTRRDENKMDICDAKDTPNILTNDTFSIFKLPTQSKNMMNDENKSVLMECDEEKYENQTITNDDTMSIFKTTKRVLDDMEISKNASSLNVFNENHQTFDMDVDNETLHQDDTMTLFNIPHRKEIPKNVTVFMDITEESNDTMDILLTNKNNLTIDMDLTNISTNQKTETFTKETTNIIKPIIENISSNQDMSISLIQDTNRQEDMFTIPNSAKETLIQESNLTMDLEESRQQKEVTPEDSHREDISSLKKSEISTELIETLQNKSREINEEEEEEEEEDDDVNDKKFEKNNGTIDFLSKSTDGIISMYSNCSYIKTQIESTRKVAQGEISMIIQEPASLIEHKRRRKSIQEQKENSILDETANHTKIFSTSSPSIPLRRDIFDLNTSIRSSPRINKNSVDNSILADSSTLILPIFDVAVSNIIWLTEEEEEGEEKKTTIKNIELLEMEKIIEEEIQKDEMNLNQSMNSELNEKIVGNKKLKTDEKDAVYASRKLAECQLLEMRLTFAEKCSLNYENQIENVKSELKKRQKILKNAEKVEQLEKEVEELKMVDIKINPIEAKKENRKLKKEIREMKQKKIEQMMESTKELLEKRRIALILLQEAQEAVRLIEEEYEERSRIILNEVENILRN